MEKIKNWWKMPEKLSSLQKLVQNSSKKSLCNLMKYLGKFYLPAFSKAISFEILSLKKRHFLLKSLYQNQYRKLPKHGWRQHFRPVYGQRLQRKTLELLKLSYLVHPSADLTPFLRNKIWKIQFQGQKSKIAWAYSTESIQLSLWLLNTVHHYLQLANRIRSFCNHFDFILFQYWLFWYLEKIDACRILLVIWCAPRNFWLFFSHPLKGGKCLTWLTTFIHLSVHIVRVKKLQGLEKTDKVQEDGDVPHMNCFLVRTVNH